MRKGYILAALMLAALMALPECVVAQRYKVGACDWMMLKRQKLGEFQLAHDLGCDGLEMDMGGLGRRDSFDNKMREQAHVVRFTRTADSLGIEVGAVAMSGFYGQSFIAKTTYRWLVEDCLNTMDIWNATVAFLPLGGCGGDVYTDTAKRAELVRRLKEVGDMAHARGKVIGLDTPLDAKGNKALLKEIGSRGIKIFYKWQTQTEKGRDICKDMKALGKKNICAIHASNTDGQWLRNDKTIDVRAIKRTLDRMKWSGWLFVERSRDTTQVRNVRANYGDNVKYLKEIFQ